ncbi:uncharacterized protein K489DRAFT_368614 [Dissoconium aciculare CBS 342.82]|uniref:Uncharacterized protein n=1 Tax=Dissoconium aciculare CBS 342.82 TaxID=1314786 RepID=A0A6J3MC47_9PEZI|nr:uncharacterized protein K489DRAFT_368614 [Dissoconium aciculare CBS 342.82]KAF1825458.1 hypothetical protein K489DRAFT_368614 [Dissoconium aciculare CBS 342.82]
MLSPKPILLTTLLSATGVLSAPTSTTTATAPPSGPTSFPASIQTALQSFQGQILHVISDYAHEATLSQQQVTTDYSSTGRALDFYLRNTFLAGGPSACPQALAGEPLPAQAEDADEGIAYLQRAQLALIDVSQDALQGAFTNGVSDFCRAIRLYGGAARSF